ncbi:Tetratricopeptide repeat protein [Pseudomonas sp. OF001]|jgi:tetratricopeptide (TPR) repeat protein|uniref:TRAP transporter TatT component family protein n=1 Tax=unclassified Pseudomonas TaxID=196821 RepID=UPI0010A5CA8B|nr:MULTISPECIES: TRAP transporter TatT component family protein [unclassified Pseudomonas]THG83316.1 tetratricopeptide repeat protein [Pseudomonas sp. A-1]WPP47660.1 TRAP transporter TatT component family protein [Pseudomonas sp. AN-1]CAD5376381.1 Tetratricopeptide repeat protein [Pseudomonas sp. OF001]
MSKSFVRNLVLGGALLLSLPSFALTAAGEQSLKQLQGRWAEINYQLPEAQREAAFARLAGEAEAVVKAEPQAPELLIWNGIILSTWAGAKGGLGALDLVKQARSQFERAIELDPKALDGSAYTSLGSLYYQVPGWPVGFGDDERAEQLLKQALTLNPDGIDPNYFYGDFLLREKRYAEAEKVLEQALAAPPRPGREVADAGRRKEAQALLEKARAKLR